MIVVSDAYRAAPEMLVHSFAHALPQRWYRMAAMLNGATRSPSSPVSSAPSPGDARTRGGGRLSRPGRGDLFLPYLVGRTDAARRPARARRRLRPRRDASRVDVARAAMEGVALTLADARDCLRLAGATIERAGLIGGGARSALWTRMIAAAIGFAIARSKGGEIGPAYGAARLARIAATGEAPEAVCLPPKPAT